MGKSQNKHSKHFFFKSLLDNVLFGCTDTLNREQVNLLAKAIRWEKVTDDQIKYNDDLLDKLNWKLYIDKHRALRIALSDLSDNRSIDKFPLHIYEYHFEEVIKAICVYPSIIEKVTLVDDMTFNQLLTIARSRPEFLTMYDFDVHTLSSEELLSLVKVGNKEFNNSLDIDFSKLPIRDRYKIMESGDFAKESLDKAGAFNEDFDHSYYVRNIIIKTGDEYIDLLNVSNLYPSDWIKILRQHRHLIDRVDISEFLSCDTHYLVDLCMIMPEYVEYITSELSHKISSTDWSRILIKFGTDDENRLIKLCDFSKIKGKSWDAMGREKPELLLYKL